MFIIFFAFCALIIFSQICISLFIALFVDLCLSSFSGLSSMSLTHICGEFCDAFDDDDVGATELSFDNRLRCLGSVMVTCESRC